MQPEGQRGLCVWTVAFLELSGFRDVIDGRGGGEVQQAGGRDRSAARRVHGGCGCVRGAGGGHRSEHGRLQAVLSQAEEGAVAARRIVVISVFLFCPLVGVGVFLGATEFGELVVLEWFSARLADCTVQELILENMFPFFFGSGC